MARPSIDTVLAAVKRGATSPEQVVGERIRKTREQQSVTLRALARVLGVSAPFLSDVEHGRRRLTPERVVATAKALGIDARELEAVAGICAHCHGTGRRVALDDGEG